MLAIGRIRPGLFELTIGRYASRAFDACVRAGKQRVTELREGARLGVLEWAGSQTYAVITPAADSRPSRLIESSRILYFWTLPVIVIGNSSTRIT